MTAFAALSVLLLSSVSWTGTDAVYKLQNDSKPISYELHLEPHIGENYFNGTVTINFTVTITSTLLMFNQNNLKIDTVEIEGIPIWKWDADHEKQVLFIYCEKELVKGNYYLIKVKYRGEFNDRGYGFFKSSYRIGKETRWIAATQFEPYYARYAFPCWDEPMYKAVFDIKITHLSNYTAVISNMPVLNKAYHNDDTVTTYFKLSMPMSTYLVAFMVSDYAFKSFGNHRFKIFTKVDSLLKTELAYNFSVQAMEVMDEFTDIPYFKINPKLDQVTIKNFRDIGMENWGLLTYSENTILYEEGVSSITDKDNLMASISRELAQQWFGNLVSPKGWQFTWLTEGFSEYFEYYIMDRVKTWRYMDFFPVKTMQWEAFSLDGWNNTLPLSSVEDNWRHSDGMRNIVSHSKCKGINIDNLTGCIIRMLSHIVSDKIFRVAVKNYLRANSFGLVDTDNLIGHLQAVAGQNTTWGSTSLSKIVESWLTLQGYPIVTVRKTSPAHYTLTQQQFLYNEPALDQIEPVDKKMWWIPITYTSNQSLHFADTTVSHWMNSEDSHLTLYEPNTDWILLNIQQTGYYRVNYDDEIWHKVIEFLRSRHMSHIHPVNRAQLIDDSMAVAHINHTKYGTALSLTLYLNSELDYIPWMTAFKHLNYVYRFFHPSQHFYLYKQYIRYIMHSLTKNVTYVASPKDDHITKLLKLNAMQLACLAEVPECVNEAFKEFNAWLKNSSHRLDPDLRHTILCTGLRNATEDTWDEVRFRLIDTGRSLEVLGCSNNFTILEKFLIYSAQEDANIIFSRAAGAVLANANVDGIKIIKHMFDYEMDKIKDMHHFDDQVASVARQFSKYVTKDKDYLWLSELVYTVQLDEYVVNGIMMQSMRQIQRINGSLPVFDEWLLKHQDLFKSSGSANAFLRLLLIFTVFNTMLFKMFL